jgi:hypothetical protein
MYNRFYSGFWRTEKRKQVDDYRAGSPRELMA